jgi:hypothetical protein
VKVCPEVLKLLIQFGRMAQVQRRTAMIEETMTQYSAQTIDPFGKGWEDGSGEGYSNYGRGWNEGSGDGSNGYAIDWTDGSGHGMRHQ